MKRLGELLVVLLACALLAGTVSAQQVTLDEAKQQIEMIGQIASIQLNITDDQQAQFKSLFNTLQQSCDAILKSSDVDVNKIAKIQAGTDTAIKSALGVLSDVQKSTALAIGTSMLSQYRSGVSFVVPSSDIIGALTQTGLSRAKAEGIVEVAKAHIDGAKKIYGDASLSQDAVNTQIDALRKGSIDSIGGKLDSGEKEVMDAVVKALEQNVNTFKTSFNENQRPLAEVVVAELLRLAETSIVIK